MLFHRTMKAENLERKAAKGIPSHFFPTGPKPWCSRADSIIATTYSTFSFKESLPRLRFSSLVLDSCLLGSRSEYNVRREVHVEPSCSTFNLCRASACMRNIGELNHGARQFLARASPTSIHTVRVSSEETFSLVIILRKNFLRPFQSP